MTTFEQSARERKCAMIVNHILKDVVKMAESLTEDEWQNLAAQVGVNQPSAESQKLIVKMLRDKLEGMK